MKVIKTTPEAPGALPLGRQGENGARQIVIDYGKWREEFGEGTLLLLLMRPGSAGVYPAAAEAAEDGTAVWTVSATDTAYAGTGRCEMQYSVDDVLVKSSIRETRIEAALEGAVIDPDDEAPFIDRITALVREASAAAAEALIAARTATDSADAARADAERLSTVETGAQVNRIEIVAVNGTDLVPDAEKRVTVPVPTAVGELANNMDFRTGAQVAAAVAAAVAGIDAELASYVLKTAYNAAMAGINNALDDLETAVETAEGRLDGHDTAIAGKQDALTFDTAPTSGSTNPVTSGGVKTALDGKQETLTFDTAPTAGSANPVTSGGVYAAISGSEAGSVRSFNGRTGAVTPQSGDYTAAMVGAQEPLTFDRYPDEGSMNPVRSDGLFRMFEGKQDTLTFDNRPRERSDNPVTSEGIFAALEEVYDRIYEAEDRLDGHDTAIAGKQDALTFDDNPREGSFNPVTSEGVYEAIAGKQDALTFDRYPDEGSMNPVRSDGLFRMFEGKQDALTFDNRPRERSDNPVTSEGIFAALEEVYDRVYEAEDRLDGHDTAIAGKQDALTFDDSPREGSFNPVTSEGVYEAIAGKQDALAFDTAPTSGSTNPVTSGGVYAAISASEAGSVRSFNGRTGAVTPQSGDYTAAMVGAPDTSDMADMYAGTRMLALGWLQENRILHSLSDVELHSVTLTNSEAFPFNSSMDNPLSIAFDTVRGNTDYTVSAEIVSSSGPVSEIIISDKALNGCKIGFTGSAASATFNVRIQGGLA